MILIAKRRCRLSELWMRKKLSYNVDISVDLVSSYNTLAPFLFACRCDSKPYKIGILLASKLIVAFLTAG